MNLQTPAYSISAAILRPFARHLVKEARCAVSILMFHGIYENDSDALKCPSSRSNLALKASLRRLQKNFQFLAMDDALELMAQKTKQDKPGIVLTFDDSIKSSARIAAPILSSLGVPATFYVSSKVIDEQRYYWWHRLEFSNHYSDKTVEVQVAGETTLVGNQSDILLLKQALKNLKLKERSQVVDDVEARLDCRLGDHEATYPCAEIMSWEDVKGLANNGFTIGNHTVNHENLTLLDEASIIQEVKSAAERISAMIGVTPRHLCYPYGLYDERVERCAVHFGVESIVTSEDVGWNNSDTSPLRLKRVSLRGDGERVIDQLDGTEQLMQKIRNRFFI